MKLLVTGASGFTGSHLIPKAIDVGWEIGELSADLTDAVSVKSQILTFKPDAVIHLGGISAVTHGDLEEFYRVNLFGTINLLEALKFLEKTPRSVLLASSATVYGNVEGLISENVCPKPVSHYAMSKLAMEHMALTYKDSLPIVITRPFNYTGIGHDIRFIIPKIVEHFARMSPVLELGDISVGREFNDVRNVCDTYLKLLELGKPREVYNICSGRPIALAAVIEMMIQLTGFRPEIRVNPEFLRDNEVQTLFGDSSKLEQLLGPVGWFELSDTLTSMLSAAN